MAIFQFAMFVYQRVPSYIGEFPMNKHRYLVKIPMFTSISYQASGNFLQLGSFTPMHLGWCSPPGATPSSRRWRPGIPRWRLRKLQMAMGVVLRCFTIENDDISCKNEWAIPPGNLTQLLKMTIYSGFSHVFNGDFTAMLNYQRVKPTKLHIQAKIAEKITWYHMFLEVHLQMGCFPYFKLWENIAHSVPHNAVFPELFTQK